MSAQLRRQAHRAVFIPDSTGCKAPLSRSLALAHQTLTSTSSRPRQYAIAATLIGGLGALKLPADYIPPTQPPSARPPEARKSQLLRTYTSLLRSTPLMLLFQHNNLTAQEWAAIRRELRAALKQTRLASNDAASFPQGDAANMAEKIQLLVIRTRMFSEALKVVEFFDPTAPTHVRGGRKNGKLPDNSKIYNHDLSRAAYEAVQKATKGKKLEDFTPGSVYAQLAPVMVGPLVLLTLPVVSPAHLATALSILSPKAPDFPAPKRSKSPGYFDPLVQSGLPKLLLVGARIENQVFDLDGVRWVGGIHGGLDGLRAQLVAMLQSVGTGLASVLQSPSKNLWLAMESRRSVMDAANDGKETAEEKQASRG